MFTKQAESELITVISVDNTGKETRVRKCEKCGALVSNDAVVCPSCGAELSEVKV